MGLVRARLRAGEPIKFLHMGRWMLMSNNEAGNYTEIEYIEADREWASGELLWVTADGHDGYDLEAWQSVATDGEEGVMIEVSDPEGEGLQITLSRNEVMEMVTRLVTWMEDTE